MRKHFTTALTVIFLGAALLCLGWYVHLRFVSVPPPAHDGINNSNYSPEQFHYVLSQIEKQQLLAGEFRIVRSSQEMPRELKQAFADATGQRQFALANPNQKYQVADVILQPGLPVRRLLFAGESPKSWFIHYEHGGFGHSYAVLVFRRTPEGEVQFFWGGAGSDGAKNLDDLRNKVATGVFKDDLVYYW